MIEGTEHQILPVSWLEIRGLLVWCPPGQRISITQRTAKLLPRVVMPRLE